MYVYLFLSQGCHPSDVVVCEVARCLSVQIPVHVTPSMYAILSGWSSQWSSECNSVFNIIHYRISQCHWQLTTPAAAFITLWQPILVRVRQTYWRTGISVSTHHSDCTQPAVLTCQLVAVKTPTFTFACVTQASILETAFALLFAITCNYGSSAYTSK